MNKILHLLKIHCGTLSIRHFLGARTSRLHPQNRRPTCFGKRNFITALNIMGLLVTAYTIFQTNTLFCTEDVRQMDGKDVTQIAVLPEPIVGHTSQERPQAESPWSKWTFTTDDKEAQKKAQITWIPQGGKNGRGCIHLVCDTEKSWSFQSNRYPVGKVQNTLAGYVWTRCNEGMVTFRLFGQTKNYNSSGRTAGELFSIETHDWVQMMANVSAKNLNTFYILFSGRGKIDAFFEPMELFTGNPFPAKEGYNIKGSITKQVEEKMDRSPIAIAQKGGVYLGWRLLKNDSRDIGFEIRRRLRQEKNFTKQTLEPIVKTTDYFDSDIKNGSDYIWQIVPVLKGQPLEDQISEVSLSVPNDDKDKKHYLSFKLKDEGTVDRISLADLNGDGKLDYVVKIGRSIVDPYHQPNYWKKSERTIVLNAYDSSGTFLWRYDLGWSIEQGIWYSPILVEDLDGDGRAEVIAKTAKGDLRDVKGRVHSHEEYLTVFEGTTGKIITEIPWLSRVGYTYNLGCRNFLMTAYLDGQTPFLVVYRGTYGLMRMAIFQLVNGKLEKKHYWSNAYETEQLTWGQGAHRLHAADVDQDGKEEICVGSFVFDHDGSILWSLGLGHPDHLYVGDLNPRYPGLEIYLGLESRNDKNGMCMVQAKTGQYIWGYQGKTFHIHSSGLCADIDARYPGCECFGGEAKNDFSEDRFLWTADGKLLARGKTEKETGVPGLGASTVWWDETPQKAMLRGNAQTGVLMKLQYPKQTYLHDRFEGNVLLTGDFFGDWREEIVTFVSSKTVPGKTLPGEIRIYTTTIPAKDRHNCLLQDRNYRATTIENMCGYSSTPTLSYELNSKYELNNKQ